MWALVFLGLALSGACKEEFVPPPPEKNETPKSKNVIKVDVTVPAGKKVDCTDFLDPEKIGAHLGDVVRLQDRAKSNVEATAVCGVIRDGEPPASAAKYDDKKRGQVLGVLPGDEYCTITLYCSLPMDEKQFRERCEEKGHSSNRELDQFACVQESQRAAKYAYTYRTIHAPTNCVVEVMGGPSVTDEPLVQNCTRAALEQITPAGLKNFK